MQWHSKPLCSRLQSQRQGQRQGQAEPLPAVPREQRGQKTVVFAALAPRPVHASVPRAAPRRTRCPSWHTCFGSFRRKWFALQPVASHNIGSFFFTFFLKSLYEICYARKQAHLGHSDPFYTLQFLYRSSFTNNATVQSSMNQLCFSLQWIPS